MYLGQIKKGMKGTVILAEPLPGRYSANVTIVDQVIDAASGTFGALVTAQSQIDSPCKDEMPG
jgi:hypothetical protein